MLIGPIGNAIIDAVQSINNYIDARNERIATEEKLKELKREENSQHLRELKESVQTLEQVRAEVEKQKQRDLMREDIRRLTRRADNYLKLI